MRRTIQSRRAQADQELAGSERIQEKVMVTSSPDGAYRFSFLGT